MNIIQSLPDSRKMNSLIIICIVAFFSGIDARRPGGGRIPLPPFGTTVRNVTYDEVVFNLYTRTNLDTPYVLKIGNRTNLENSPFNPSTTLKVFTHGLTPEADNADIRNAFLNASDTNVILVDWTLVTTNGTEDLVISKADDVGQMIAEMIDWLSTFGLKHSNVHLVGISLGSHVTGWAGRSCKRGQVEIITVCDPAKNTWENNTDRVNAGDAKYVEVIHSNTFFHGLIYPTGTADFYPNGGSKMPGCPDEIPYFCDHLKALEYFIDSIDHQGFKAWKCNGYEEIVGNNCSRSSESFMGGSVLKPISGVYYLETNAEKPFYQN